MLGTVFVEASRFYMFYADISTYYSVNVKICKCEIIFYSAITNKIIDRLVTAYNERKLDKRP